VHAKRSARSAEVDPLQLTPPSKPELTAMAETINFDLAFRKVTDDQLSVGRT